MSRYALRLLCSIALMVDGLPLAPAAPRATPIPFLLTTSEALAPAPTTFHKMETKQPVIGGLFHDLAPFLKSLRQGTGMRLRPFAKALGLPDSVVLAYESGSKIPSPHMRALYATLSNTPLEAFDRFRSAPESMESVHLRHLIAERIRAARATRQVTDKQIAKRLHGQFAPAALVVQALDRGYLDLTINDVLAQAALLDVSWSYLLGSGGRASFGRLSSNELKERVNALLLAHDTSYAHVMKVSKPSIHLSIKTFINSLSNGTLSAYHFWLFARAAGIALPELAQLTEIDKRHIHTRKTRYVFPSDWQTIKNAIEGGEPGETVQQQTRRMADAEPLHFQLLKAILNLGHLDRYGSYSTETYAAVLKWPRSRTQELLRKIINSLLITRLVDAQPRLLGAAS